MNAPRPRPQPSRRTTWLLLALACSTYFVALGTPPLWDANEPLYAQPPKEVLDWPQGDFWAPTWNGRPYFAHAPLSTWITVPFYAWLGAGELGHRRLVDDVDVFPLVGMVVQLGVRNFASFAMPPLDVTEPLGPHGIPHVIAAGVLAVGRGA